MMKTSGRKIIFYSFHPLIGKNFTTRITEASFTGMRNDNNTDQDVLDKHICDNLAFRDHGKKASSLLSR